MYDNRLMQEKNKAHCNGAEYPMMMRCCPSLGLRLKLVTQQDGSN